jgi:hypothetical protein
LFGCDPYKQHTWKSSAGGKFTVNPDSSEMGVGRGTRIVLHLKEDMKEYLEERRIKDLVKKHSEFIGFPIKLQVEKTSEKEVEEDDEEEEDDKKEGEEDGPKIEDVSEDDKKTKKTKKIKVGFLFLFQLINHHISFLTTTGTSGGHADATGGDSRLAGPQRPRPHLDAQARRCQVRGVRCILQVAFQRLGGPRRREALLRRRPARVSLVPLRAPPCPIRHVRGRLKEEVQQHQAVCAPRVHYGEL